MGLAFTIRWQMTTDLSVLTFVLEELEDHAICKLMKTAFSVALHRGT